MLFQRLNDYCLSTLLFFIIFLCFHLIYILYHKFFKNSNEFLNSVIGTRTQSFAFQGDAAILYTITELIAYQNILEIRTIIKMEHGTEGNRTLDLQCAKLTLLPAELQPQTGSFQRALNLGSARPSRSKPELLLAASPA